MPDYINPNFNPQGAVKALPIIHLGLLMGQVLFAIVVYYITPQKGFSLNENDPFVFVAIALAAGGFIGGNLIFKQTLAKIPPDATLSQKIAAYQTAFIIRAALMEGPSLFSIAVYMLGGNLFFLAVTALIVLYFITFRPTKEKITADLNLDYSEKTALDSQVN
jgi:hypothetical protein